MAGHGPVPLELLRFSATSSADLWSFSNQREKVVPIVRLKDGAILLPVEDFDELKGWLESQEFSKP